MDEVDRWGPLYGDAADEWHRLIEAEQARDAGLMAAWKRHLLQVKEEEQKLVSAGRWRGGPRTLLAAIGVHYRELAMTAGLAWLLRPDGASRARPGERDQARSYYPWPYWRYQTPPAQLVALKPDDLARDLFTSFCNLWEEATLVLDALHPPQAPALSA